jgi:hypothetical protein
MRRKIRRKIETEKSLERNLTFLNNLNHLIVCKKTEIIIYKTKIEKI